MILSAFIVGAVSAQALSLSHAEITNMVEKIKQERTGIELDRLASTPNPFAVHAKNEKVIHEVETHEEVVQEVVYRLTAIFNRAAFINGKWYKKGAEIDHYTISKVGTQSVTLVNGNDEKTLSLPKKKNIITFKGK